MYPAVDKDLWVETSCFIFLIIVMCVARKRFLLYIHMYIRTYILTYVRMSCMVYNVTFDQMDWVCFVC